MSILKNKKSTHITINTVIQGQAIKEKYAIILVFLFCMCACICTLLQVVVVFLFFNIGYGIILIFLFVSIYNFGLYFKVYTFSYE